MPIKTLTELFVAKVKAPPPGKQIDYSDAGMPGLVLRVNYGGAKIWRARYYRKATDADGNKLTLPTTHKLGRYPHLKLKEAREAARQFLADPQKALAQPAAGSFKDVAENFIKRHVQASGLRSQGEIERCLRVYVYPTWEHRPFAELRRGDVAALLDSIEDNHGKRQADVVLAVVRKLMNWFATRSDDYMSPIVQGMKRNTGDTRRQRTLDDDEIRAVFKAADACGTFGALVKTLLLTGQRKGKVSRMTWDAIVDGEWRIPSEPREKGTAGTLRLPPVVLDIIAKQPRIAGNPFVFAGRGAAAFSSFGQGKHDLDAKLPAMPPWTLHDLRRSARSLMSRAGVRPDIAERVLGHAIVGVEGVYDRFTYPAEKADALQRLSALVDSIVSPPGANVVPMRR